MSETCGHCRFWDVRDGDEKPWIDRQFAPCKRFPPVPEQVVTAEPSRWREGIHVTIQYMSKGARVYTERVDFCGEFQRQLEERSDTATAQSADVSLTPNNSPESSQ